MKIILRQLLKFAFCMAVVISGSFIFANAFFDVIDHVRAQDARPATTLPQRDQLSVQDVKDALADCTIQMREESRYEQKLISRIRELEGELAKLKSDAKPAVKP